MNGRAFLSMQFMIEGGEGAVSFVEYVVRGARRFV
jgi:hypothetical protein